jgi:hypothetical protein
MNALKTGMTFLAYTGIAMIVLGIIGVSWTAASYLQSSAYSWTQPLAHEWDGLPLGLGFLVSIPGLILVLIGGMIARPRYLGPVLVATGLIFCISATIAIATPPIKKQDYELSGVIINSIVISLPGIICIIEGIVILWLRRKRKTEPAQERIPDGTK